MPKTANQLQLEAEHAPSLERVHRDLSTDLVQPLSRVLAESGLSPRAISREFHVFDVFVETATHHARASRTTCVAVEPLERRATEIRHLLGIASMRRELGVPPEHWRLYEAYDPIAPDAEWRVPHGTIAIEFDAGSYSRQVIVTKTLQFGAAYRDQVWGMLGEARRATVLKHMAGTGRSPKSMVINWRE
jgi:hypothetical protein